MKELKHLYFAYGSNMDLAQMEKRIPGDFEVLGTGILNDWDWLINQRGYANILAKVRAQTHGVLFNLSESGLAGLDRYEGYPDLYDRKVLPVEHNKRTYYPWVYVDFVSQQPGKPRTGYLERVIIAAMGFKLPNQYIAHLATFLPY